TDAARRASRRSGRRAPRGARPVARGSRVRLPAVRIGRARPAVRDRRFAIGPLAGGRSSPGVRGERFATGRSDGATPAGVRKWPYASTPCASVRERRFTTAGRHRLRATDHPRTEHRTPNTEHRTPNTGSPPFIRPSPVRAKRPAASGRRAPPNFRQ
ncbi:hypothetical protein, partial [Burkholderia pseudomallei]|uniref:hypothetical protein n=1 Tax=Burkholderia pseudomallei TaxID=28450 RepID=UPI001C4B797C